MKRRKSQEDPVAAVGIVFIAPVTARQADLSNLLSFIMLILYLTFDHQTVETWDNTGLITVV